MSEKKVTKKEQAQPVDLLDVLLDKNNKEPIVLMDEKGRQISFEQVAIIPYDINDTKVLYVVLKPIDKIDGIADDEAVVFLVDQDKNGNTVLRVEEDDLLEEARAAAPKKTTTAKKAPAKTATTKKAPAKTTAPAKKVAGKKSK